MKILITGSKDFSDYPFFKRKMVRLTSKLTKYTIVTGSSWHAANRCAATWCFENAITRIVHNPDEKKDKTGEITAKEMATNADMAILFLTKKRDKDPVLAMVIKTLVEQKKKMRVILWN